MTITHITTQNDTVCYTNSLTYLHRNYSSLISAKIEIHVINDINWYMKQ